MPSTSAGTFELVGLTLARALEPLAARLHDPHHARMLIAELGLVMPEQIVSPALVTAFQTIHTAAHAIRGEATTLAAAIDADNVGQIVSEGVSLARSTVTLIQAFDTIVREITALGSVPSVTNAELTAFLTGLPDRLFQLVVVEYLEGNHRTVFALLELLGIVERTRANIGSTNPGQPEVLRKRLRFDRIGQLLQSPDQIFATLYGWGQPGLPAGMPPFDGNLLVRRVGALLRAMRIPTTIRELPGTPPRTSLEVCVLRFAPTDAATPGKPGLEAIVTTGISDGISIDLPIVPGWQAQLRAEGALQASVGMRVQPPAEVSLIPPSGTVQGRMKAGVARVPVAPETRIMLLGIAGGTGLSVERIELRFISGFRWDTSTGDATGDVGFEGELRGGKLKIGMDGADGFLGTLLSGVSVEADFNLGLGWTALQGIYFTGSSTLEIQLPAHISLGPIELSALTLRVGIDGNRFPIGLATDIKAELGPLKVTVEQIGAAVELSFPADGRGDIGPLDIDFKFLPPRGAGLSLDAGVVKGGGYVFFDPERGEYAGALELTFSETIGLKAIGIITTKMPDGSDGFSLLIIISVDFGTGLQLGYGFTLLAVGGLIGVNRTMKLDALMEGVRSGAIESIMFPTDIVANAPKIISDLRAFFPPREGMFLIGPMAKLGWGTPTLISISLGIIIEIPGNIAIVGVLKVALPTEEASLIRLQVNFAGAIEFDKKRIYFFASLFESRILFMTIEGEMGLLVAWGDDANFVVSVGGFHPRFQAPPLPFPSPRRIAIDILNTPVAKIRVEGYLAVTSNTAQFGARAELFFGLDILNVRGHLAFDALFQFSPFYFIIEISASVSVNLFGAGLFSISLSGELSGPGPWHIKGHGSFSILFWDVDVEFEETWGERHNTELPAAPVLPILLREIDKADNWRAALPASNRLLVTLRKLPSDAPLILHPLGTLRISQRALPLELVLDKVGTQKPSDVNRLSIAVTGGGLTRKADAFERFAPAQFQNFADSDKLSKPAFSPERSGVELSAAGQDLQSSRVVQRAVRYEEIIIDNNFKRFARRFRLLLLPLFQLFLRGNSAARSPLSAANLRRLQPFPDKIVVRDETFTVAFQTTNKAFEATSFHSEASARDFLHRKIAENGALADELHVIPSFERAA
jgi:hypothetical protein